MKDKHHITPLLAAVWEGHTKCVQLLIEKVLFKIMLTINNIKYLFSFQGADKGGKTPDGSKYLDVVEKDEIRKLLL